MNNMKTFRDVYVDKYGSKHRGSIHCTNRHLTSLEGAPRYISGYFDCHNNDLETLEGAPVYVGGSFYCYNNEDLQTLEGGPKYVAIDFYCTDNKLESLKGAPVYVGGSFYCYNNKDLQTLEGIPVYIGDRFISDSKLLYGENLYIIITSLIRGRYNVFIKEGEELKEHILDQLKTYFGRK